MKSIISSILVCMAVVAFGQQPPSFFHTYLDEAPTVDFAPFHFDQLMQEANRYEEEEGRTMQGQLRYDDFDFFSLADHTELNDGTSIWRLNFHSDAAQAICVYFDQFHLPVGSKMYIYDADKQYFEGPIGHEENNNHGRFMTNDIWGENIVVEYVHTAEVIGTPSLNVMAIGYIFRYAYPPAELNGQRGGSQPCEVDVNCPEIDGWEEQRDAVVRLRITDSGQQFLCSGAMVNNTTLDCKQYLLSALHCADGVSDDDFAFLQVRFNYERPFDDPCGTGGFSSSRNRTGVFHVADSNDNGAGGFEGSDFLLLEVEDDIPDAWNPYFAGWDASGSGSGSGVSIHHPAGDIKKISTYTSNLQSVWLGAPGSHWQVVWTQTETDHGVTEGGSSGSPIFNNDGLIVGTLSAGLSACTNGGAGAGTGPNEPDYYGKMSYHWDFNPNSDNQKLHLFLEPFGVGIKECPGTYRPCANAFVNVTEATSDQYLHISPNPTTGEIFVRVSELMVKQIHVFDMNGRVVFTLQAQGPVSQLDLSKLPAGSYVLVVDTTAGDSFNQRVVKL
ncbi:MAG: T9SS type A sorting domain-containing protein [Flavobacteriales bacterium]|nr:T9SS type A sorting domain-containing protein [Flavobacteriales bacterium]